MRLRAPGRPPRAHRAVDRQGRPARIRRPAPGPDRIRARRDRAETARCAPPRQRAPRYRHTEAPAPRPRSFRPMTPPPALACRDERQGSRIRLFRPSGRLTFVMPALRRGRDRAAAAAQDAAPRIFDKPLMRLGSEGLRGRSVRRAAPTVPCAPVRLIPRRRRTARPPCALVHPIRPQIRIKICSITGCFSAQTQGKT